MKKIIPVLMAVLLISSFVKINAQEDLKPFRFGLHASPSISWIKPDVQEYESDGSKIGFSYGVIADFNLSENYAVSTGIDISYFGGKASYEDKLDPYGFESTETGNIKSTYNLQYLQIPVMIKMSTNEIGYFTYFANVGLGTAIRLKASGEDVYNETTITREDLSDDVAFFRESLIIGLGTEYSIAENVSLIGALNFNNGFTTTIKRKNHDLDKNGNAIANYIELKLGIIF
ncbi:MAG: PorT family protein [Bacteroidales bacterium]|nr:PorT family protein [Bacteroidales bacterium]